jgi:hypothetical protein
VKGDTKEEDEEEKKEEEKEPAEPTPSVHGPICRQCHHHQ